MDEWYNDAPMSPVQMLIKSAQLAGEAGDIKAEWEYTLLVLRLQGDKNA